MTIHHGMFHPQRKLVFARPIRWVFACGAIASMGFLSGPPAANGANAAGIGLPTSVCHAACPERPQRIWTRFERGINPALTSLPAVYAGVCHVLGDHANPQREHHVGFLIDNSGDNRTDNSAENGNHPLRLRFSFFTQAQPYDQLDASQAAAHFGAPVLRLAVHDGYAYAESTDFHLLARYWFRRDRDSERVLMVSYFGPTITILCDAVRNRRVQ